MKWTCLNDIYKFKSVTSSRYIYYGNSGHYKEVDLDNEAEIINHIFLPDRYVDQDLSSSFYVANKGLRFSFHIYIDEENIILHTISPKASGVFKFKLGSLYECIEKLHIVYLDLISTISANKRSMDDFTSRKKLEQAYTTYHDWTRKLMKIFTVLFVIAVMSATLTYASFLDGSSDKWWYLGVLTLNALVWTMFLLIDRHKMLNLRKLQLKESERLNSKGYGTSDYR